MKWMKRAWLSIIRRPFKTSMLFLVVFVMSNLLAGSLAIISTSKTVKEELKKGILPEASIVYKTNKKVQLTDDVLNEYTKVLNELNENEKVVGGEVSYSYKAYATYEDLGFGNDQRKLEFELYGTNVKESSNFKEGLQELTTMVGNRSFTDEEVSGADAYILTDYSLKEIKLAPRVVEQSGLCIPGNEVTLTLPINYKVEGKSYTYEHEFTAKVIGVFNNTNKSPIKKTMVYIPSDALLRIIDEANINSNVNATVYPKIEFASFQLDNLEDLTVFDETAKAMVEKLPAEFKYTSSNELYKRNVGPVETLDVVAKVIFVSAILAMVIICGLIIFYLISDRKKELGIYISIGERSKNVLAQIVGEVILVSLIAISCASVSGIFVGNKLSNYMLEVQRYVERGQNLGYLAKIPKLYKPIEDGLTMQSRDDVIDLYEVKPNVEYFAILYSVGSTTVIISSILPMMYVTRLKPKNIML